MSRFANSSSTRRVFMMQVATAATAVLAVSEASAQAMVDEKDPQAAGLAYKADGTKVDKAGCPLEQTLKRQQGGEREGEPGHARCDRGQNRRIRPRRTRRRG